MAQGTGVGVTPPGVAVAVAVAGTGVGVGPPGVMVSQAAEIGPQVSKPWNWLTPRPRTKIRWRPTDRLAVLMVACTGTVWLPKAPVMGTAVPPAQGGVSI